MTAFDPFWWWAGRRYGDRVTQVMAIRSPRTGAVPTGACGCSTASAAGPLSSPTSCRCPTPSCTRWPAGPAPPPALHRARSGRDDAAGRPERRAGYALGARAAPVAGLISRYSIAVTVALIAVMILLARWRNRRGAAGPVTVNAGWEPAALARPRRRRACPRGAAATGPDPVETGRGPTVPRPHRWRCTCARWSPTGWCQAWSARWSRPAARRPGTFPAWEAAARPAPAAGDRLGDQGLHRAPACRYGRRREARSTTRSRGICRLSRRRVPRRPG